jgi:transposase
MQVIHLRCGGIEIHPKTIVVTTIITRSDGSVQKERRVFTTMISDLLALDDWLDERQIEIVAMKSTGTCWHPVFHVLETGRAIILISARHLKGVPALSEHKVAIKDSDWLASVLRHGLLRANFVPPQPNWEVCELMRYRKKLVQERAGTISHLQKLLAAVNPEVATITITNELLHAGGRRLLGALSRERDPALLPEFTYRRLQEQLLQLRQALKGRLRPHQRFLLFRVLEHLDFLDTSLMTFQTEIERWLSSPSEEKVRILQSVLPSQ